MLGGVREGFDVAERAFQLILAAVIASKVRLSSFEIFLPVSVSILDLQKTLSRHVKSRFRSLRSLSIELKMATRSDRWAYPVLSIINLFPDLEELDLFIREAWRANEEKPNDFQRFCRLLKASHLRVLHIGGITCTEKDLTKPILRYKDLLKELHFFDLSLTKGTWQSVVAKIRDELSLAKLTIRWCGTTDHRTLISKITPDPQDSDDEEQGGDDDGSIISGKGSWGRPNSEVLTELIQTMELVEGWYRPRSSRILVLAESSL